MTSSASAVRDTPVARLPAEIKIVALLGFVLAVVATPREMIWPYAVHLALVIAVVAVAQIPVQRIARYLTVEIPFVALALLMPFIATGPRTTFLGLSVSQTGLWGGWALLARGTLGVLAASILATTTEPAHLLAGLRRLRLPRQLVEIAGFMLRYLNVIVDQWRWMGIARKSRGFVASSPAAWPVLGRSLGALFVRAYERGERVHLAMLARGYTGTPPEPGAAAVHGLVWLQGLALPLAAAAVAAAAWMVR